MMADRDWKVKAEAARVLRDESLLKVEPPIERIPEKLPPSSQGLPKQLLTAREFELTENFDAITLLTLLRKRTISSEELTRAFLRRAAIAQYAVNCVTELLWDEAIERARYLDSLPEPCGPLHGLPISVKEHHGLFGKPTHAAYVSWIGKPSLSNTLNDILWNAGCVFYVRTTGPQTHMQLETNSNIYGRTVNPWNRELTAGGSSGGEGALIGMRGSVLGLGGDIGGSVRGPASNNGIYGFKPTSRRLPLKGMIAAYEGRHGIDGTYGPLCVSRETINVFMKVVLDTQPWRSDPSLTPLPWTPITALKRPLKIAIEWCDGVVKPHPPIIRALKEVAEVCRDSGMNVVDWEPVDHARAWDITTALYFSDGGTEALQPIYDSGEPVLPLVKWLLESHTRVKTYTMAEYWELCRERDDYREAYAAHWNHTGENGNQEVDVIVAPAVPGAAPPHDSAKYWGYTAQWNLLDYPSVVFPVTFVDPGKDKKDETYVPMNKSDKFNHELYTGPERYAGAPVSLMVVGRRNMDEKVMAALKAIEVAMGRS